jgi:glucose/arabinose dehydrogenase
MLDFTTNKANAAVPPKLGWISIVNSQTRCFLLAIAACISLGNTLSAQQEAKMPVESDYYKIVSFEIPEGVELEATSFQKLEDGRMAVSSRRGEIWLIKDPLADQVPSANFKRFAHGLHEPIGMTLKDNWLYVTQRPDVSRLRDSDGDGEADEFEVVADGWQITGDYHEYAFGSKFDRDGNIWVALCLTGSFGSDALYRGWAVRVSPDGQTIPSTSGVRSPGGVGMNAEGDIFYTDNQGPWNGTCALKNLMPGKFVGHPGGFRWYDQAKEWMGNKPAEPKDGSRFVVEADRIPEYEPPAILFPYGKMGQSAAGITCDTTDGKFGPFTKQMFVGDQTFSTVMRCYLEKVKGHYQGACFPFREGFDSGVVGLEMHPEGKMFVGGTNRGWGSRGGKSFCVQRLDWTGKTPFEILEMKARPQGFELVFTKPVDAATASDVGSYDMKSFTYIFQASYGSPEVDATTPKITSAKVSADGLRVELTVEGLQRGHIHHLRSAGVRSKENLPLLHSDAYYTLNYIPES